MAKARINFRNRLMRCQIILKHMLYIPTLRFLLISSAVLHEPELVSDEPKPSERMCRYIRPIALNLVSEEEKQRLADQLDQLDQLVKEKQYCLNTGFLTTHELCRTLSDYGHTDTAYRLLLKEECLGWLYSVKCGATTVPENWDAYGKDGSRNASFNHYSYGSIVGCLMDTAAVTLM